MGTLSDGLKDIRSDAKGKGLTPSHECIDCGHTVGGHKHLSIDGMRCPRCLGPLIPITSNNNRVRKDGLTEQEGKVMDALVTAWNEFSRLDMTHPSDKGDFCNGIHQCQQILGMRVLQRDYPEGYPIK